MNKKQCKDLLWLADECGQCKNVKMQIIGEEDLFGGKKYYYIECPKCGEYFE